MIYCEIDLDDLFRIERALGMAKDKSKFILRAAINNTAKEAQKRIVEGINKKYVWKTKKDIKNTSEIKKAKTNNLVAEVKFKSPAGELYDFKVSPHTVFPGGKGGPRWFKGKAVRSSRLQSIALKKGSSGDQYKGFTVRYQSGHETFAQRVPGKRMKSKPYKEAVKTLFAPSVPTMGSKVYEDSIGADIEDVLAANIRAQVERFLG